MGILSVKSNSVVSDELRIKHNMEMAENWKGTSVGLKYAAKVAEHEAKLQADILADKLKQLSK